MRKLVYGKTKAEAREQFKELLQKAELPATIRFHGLRHFAATMMLAIGSDIAITQAVLGIRTRALLLFLTPTRSQVEHEW
jgi:integrase